MLIAWHLGINLHASKPCKYLLPKHKSHIDPWARTQYVLRLVLSFFWALYSIESLPGHTPSGLILAYLNMKPVFGFLNTLVLYYWILNPICSSTSRIDCDGLHISYIPESHFWPSSTPWTIAIWSLLGLCLLLLAQCYVNLPWTLCFGYELDVLILHGVLNVCVLLL